MKKVAILQSNYIPWRGYFDLINYVDEFIIYDDVQYTKGDWRNRNLLNQKLETLNATLTNLRRIVNTQEPIETYKINIGKAMSIVDEVQSMIDREPFSPEERNSAIR